MALNRSFLFAPGNHARRVEKSFTLGADAVILDLEDAVALSEKAAARASVGEALRRPRNCRGYVRVNAMGTPYCYADLVSVVGPGVDGIMLPKVESAADLHAIDWLIANLERERGIAEGTLDLIPLIETATGMLRVDRILQARGLKPYRSAWRVKRVAFGAADYAQQLNIAPSEDEAELAQARSRLVLASAAARLEAPIDSPFFRLREDEACRRSGERSKRAGFQGRACIHPDHVPIANQAYSPGEAEIARARRIVAAFRQAEAEGSASIQLDGEFIDYPIAHRAQAVLDAVNAPAAESA
jgi:citrate lyase subunit beta/citryl-CoA lyase